MSRKIWTQQKIQVESNKYKTKKEFYTNSPKAYDAAVTYKLIDIVCSHMPKSNRTTWTLLELKKIAINYKYVSDFRKEHNSIYVYAHRNKLLKLISSHMIKKQRPVKWTKNIVKAEALKYKYKIDFYNNSRGAYSKASTKGWLKEICKHMLDKPLKWSKTAVRKEALKYKSKGEFIKGNASAYKVCRQNKWIEELCSHMELKGNRYNRWVYFYIGKNRSIYVGLTYNKTKRHLEHVKKNKKYAIEYDFLHYSKLLPANEAVREEKRLIKLAKQIAPIFGYTVRNKSNGGELGGRI